MGPETANINQCVPFRVKVTIGNNTDGLPKLYLQKIWDSDHKPDNFPFDRGDIGRG